MAIDTLMVFAGVYPDLESAEADYDLVKELHAQEGPGSGQSSGWGQAGGGAGRW